MNDNMGSVVLNVIGGIFSPALFCDGFSISKQSVKKYYAFNRILLSSLLIAQLSVTLNTALRAKGEAYFEKGFEFNGTITSSAIDFRIPAEYEKWTAQTFVLQLSIKMRR